MSSRLFSEHNPVTHCAPKRVRRTWGRTLVHGLMVLALAALVGWLLHCVRHAAEPLGSTLRVGSSARPWGATMPLAVLPVNQALVVGALMLISTLGIALAVRRVRRDDLAAQACRRDLQARREDAEDVAFWDSYATCRSKLHAADGVTTVALSLSLEDLRGIVDACRVECRMSLLLVEASLTTTTLEDYMDALRVVQAKQTQVTRTLSDLLRSLQIENTEVRA